jgi:hypothetical protein
LLSQKCLKYQLPKLNKFPSINPIFLSPSADSTIVAYGYDGWKGERLTYTLTPNLSLSKIPLVF